MQVMDLMDVLEMVALEEVTEVEVQRVGGVRLNMGTNE